MKWYAVVAPVHEIEAPKSLFRYFAASSTTAALLLDTVAHVEDKGLGSETG